MDFNTKWRFVFGFGLNHMLEVIIDHLRDEFFTDPEMSSFGHSNHYV